MKQAGYAAESPRRYLDCDQLTFGMFLPQEQHILHTQSLWLPWSITCSSKEVLVEGCMTRVCHDF